MTEQRRAGRPRNEDYDDRIVDAARRLFSSGGSAGLTFEAVAREAGVGKPAVYRRWDSLNDLLMEVFARHRVPGSRDLGSLAEDLTSYATDLHDYLCTDMGQPWLRLQFAMVESPELQQLYVQRVTAALLGELAQICGRAVSRGEISSVPPLAFLAELIVGPITMRILHTPSAKRLRLRSGQNAYVTRLVMCLLPALEVLATDLDRRQADPPAETSSVVPGDGPHRRLHG